MSALVRSRSVPTNVPNATNVEYYTQRAAGGAGLIISEATLVSQQGTGWIHNPGLWNQEQVAAWKKVTDAVHAQGGAIFSQLWHAGRASHPDAPEQIKSGQPVYAPSAISARGGQFKFLPGNPGYVTPTAVDDPRTLIALYKQAAINAKAAGFDGVELHSANGYLAHLFLDSTTNKRTDSWGGSVENRARFVLETLKELVDVWGPGRVGIKLSPVGGYNDMGMPLEETLATFRYVIDKADKLSLAYICLVRYVAKLDMVYDGKLRATQHDVLASYRPYIKHTQLLLNGGLTPSEAGAIVGSGAADAAVFGWLWIGHPDLANRIAKGQPLDAVVDATRLYTVEDGDIKKGYTDYPAWVEATA